MDKKRHKVSNSQSPKNKDKSNPPTKPIVGVKEKINKNDPKRKNI